jgi:hypothetical protein
VSTHSGTTTSDELFAGGDAEPASARVGIASDRAAAGKRPAVRRATVNEGQGDKRGRGAGKIRQRRLLRQYKRARGG